MKSHIKPESFMEYISNVVDDYRSGMFEAAYYRCDCGGINYIGNKYCSSCGVKLNKTIQDVIDRIPEETRQWLEEIGATKPNENVYRCVIAVTPDFYYRVRFDPPTPISNTTAIQYPIRVLINTPLEKLKSTFPH